MRSLLFQRLRTISRVIHPGADSYSHEDTARTSTTAPQLYRYPAQQEAQHAAYENALLHSLIVVAATVATSVLRSPARSNPHPRRAVGLYFEAPESVAALQSSRKLVQTISAGR